MKAVYKTKEKIEVVPETTTVMIKNQYQLSATFYHPAGEMKGAVLIVPAMGVTQKYYSAFALWLSTQGYMVATFDYYGTGFSLYEHLRNISVTIVDWAEYDCTAMVDIVAKKAEGKPLYWIGHSLGGQVLGLIKNHHYITKSITIACGSGYWRENAPSLKRKVWWLWYVVAPLTTNLLGYYPGKRLRMVGDLPKGVMNQWRSWCLHPDYLVGVMGADVRKKYSAVKLPITSISFTDDALMSGKNISSIHSFYTESKKTMNRYSPDDLGVKHVGHFGFFKKEFESVLWKDCLLSELQDC